MKSQLLVTAFGEDRPGIVARLSEVLLAGGANLEGSRMAKLGGDFAAIILASVPEEAVADLEKRLAGLEAESLTIHSKITSRLDPDRFKGYLPYRLAVNGADHEGIVNRVTGYLRDESINIESMESQVVSAPVTGTPLFCMAADLQVPPTLAISELKSRLQSIGDAEAVEIELSVKT